MEYLDAKQAADYLDVEVSTIYAYVSRGLLDSRPVPGDKRRRCYLKEDLDRLRRRSSAHRGHGAAAAEALHWGAASLETSICKIGPTGPAYRGRPLRELVADEADFEEVAEFLWGGAGAESQPDWGLDRAEPVSVGAHLGSHPHPVDILRLAVAVAGVEDPARFGPSDAGAHRCARHLISRAVATLLGCRCPSMAAAGSVADTLALLSGKPPTPPVRRLINTTLVVCAEHGLNASSFAGRVAASTGADLYACVEASLAAFSGPKHGGASERAAALLDEVDTDTDDLRGHLFDNLSKRLRRGDELPGFGHRLYPTGDVRFKLLVGLLEAQNAAAEVDMARALKDCAERLELGPPNLDLGLALVARWLDLPQSGAALLFAVGRMAGWIAHAIEQRRQGFLLRPTATYVGDET